MYRLLTIPFSHYVEKARWGLDYFGQSYSESAYMPLLHFPALWWATRKTDAKGDSVSSAYSTPVLICGSEKRICDSSKILSYLDTEHGGQERSLYSEPGCREVELDVHDTLGPHTRRLGYYFILDNRRLMAKMARNNVGTAQQLVFRASLPLGRAIMKKRFGIDDAGADESRSAVRKSFGRYSETLSDGRTFLCGDKFSVADLSFSCMAAPSLLINHENGYGAYMPEMSDCPKAAISLAMELRETRAGEHALAMFKNHR